MKPPIPNSYCRHRLKAVLAAVSAAGLVAGHANAAIEDPVGKTLLAAGSSAPKANPLAKKTADPFVGVFRSKDLTAQIVSAGEGLYKGTLTLNGQMFPLTAKKDGPGISGTFESDGSKFEFLAKLEGNTLQLKSDDVVYLLVRDMPAKPENPLAKKPDSTKPESPKPVAEKPGDAKTVTLPEPGWKLFRHPIGISVRYPKDWDFKEVQGGYQLLPPKAAQDEAYILGGQPAEGIQVATDPQVIAGAEALVAQFAPALKRVGPAETLKAGETPVVSLKWEGGPNGWARMYLIVLKGQIIGLTGIGAKEKVQAREEMLRRIFTSFSQTEAQRDPQLIGAWNRLGTTSLAARDNVGRLQASSVGDHHRTLILNRDGSCESREVDRTIAIGQGVAVDTGDQVTVKRGTWYAGDGTLVLVWEKDAEEYDYKIGGQPGSRQVIFSLDKDRGLVWREAR